MSKGDTQPTATQKALGDFAPKLVELITHLAITRAKELLEERAP